ncbi:MAG: thioredoxin family protein [Bacteroidales bacterium]|nr:thioredoxin family protein [Bacteroidales bacterium]
MTNKYLTRLALPLLLLSAADAFGARIKSTLWEHPSVLVAKQDYLKVQSVQLSDTATEVTIHVLQHNGGFTFNRRTYLLGDDGRHYPIRSGKGITLGKFIQCHERDTVVTLVFDPVPRKSQSIDLIEGAGSGDFLLLGIHDGKKPLQVKPRTIDEKLFDPMRRNFFHSATATLQGHIEGYKQKEERQAFTLYITNVLTKQSQPYSLSINDDGTFKQELDLDYPIYTSARCHNIGREFYIFLKPGQTLDVTLHPDGTASYKDLSGHGWEFDKLMDIDIVYLSMGIYGYQDFQTDREELGARAFQQKLEKCFELTDSLFNYLAHRMGYNDFDYKFALLITRHRVLSWYMDYFMHDQDTTMTIAQKYAPLVRLADNDVLQLCTESYSSILNRYSFAGFMREGSPYYYIDQQYASDSLRRAADAALYGEGSPSWLSRADLLNRIYYDYGSHTRDVKKDSLAEREAVARLEADFQKRMTLQDLPFFREKAEKVFRRYIEYTDLAYDLPEGEVSDMFRRITDRYKGKYLFIDFWATGCGPCVSAIRSSLQMRKELHDNPDLKFIFITGDQESPQKTYDKFVAENLADEDTYRIPQEEFTRYKNLFQFNGIPHYEALDREGRVLRKYNDYWGYHKADMFYSCVFDPLRDAYGEIDLQQIQKEREEAEALKYANDSLYVIHAVGKIKKTGEAIDNRFVLPDNYVESFLSQTKRYKSRTSYRGDDPKRPMSDNPRSKNGVVELEVECDEDGHISVN